MDETVKGPENMENNSTDKKMLLLKVRQRKDWHHFNIVSSKLLNIKKGDFITYEIDGRQEVAEVIEKPLILSNLKETKAKLIGLATPQDMKKYYDNIEKEKKAKETCLRLNKELGITTMDLTRVESLMDGSKIIFYYYSEGRIDFRELVKQLVRNLRCRVEMRQIGIRHEAKMIGGVAHCGREMCCSLYLETFKPITLKMARHQNLLLNPTRLSGQCGRLLCCLRYELDDSFQDVDTEDEIIELSESTNDNNVNLIQDNIQTTQSSQDSIKNSNES